MLEYVIDKLIALLGPIATLSKEKRELKDSALRGISIALQETKLYYRDLGAENHAIWTERLNLQSIGQQPRFLFGT